MIRSRSFVRAFSTRCFMPQLLLCLALLGFVPGLVAKACAGQDGKHSSPAPTPHLSALKTEDLSIAFEPNLKQADVRYKFLAHRNGLAMGFLDHSIELRLATEAGNADVLGISFEGSQGRAPSAEQLLPGRVNYLRGSDPATFHRNIPTYARVRYPLLYPDIDLVFYGNGSRLEHDFVLAPGADPHAIALRFTGMRHLQLTPAGDLLIQTAQASIEFRHPFAYQETSKGKAEVAVAYRVRKGRVTFDIAPYNHSLPLIIDPVLDYSTFLSNTSFGPAFIATDGAGNTYITSLIFDATYPTTKGSLQPACASCPNLPDVVITKLNADGSGQVYSTFLGGTNYDQPFGIAVDSNGNAIVVGRTQSSDFPVKNPVSMPTLGVGDFAAFVSSLSADGSALNYSTLIGSGVEVLATAVAVDSTGNAYVTGDTSDATFPVTPGALHAVQNNTTGGGDALVFLSKFLPSGALSYSALVGDPAPQNGGGGAIGAASVAIDATGNAYIYGNAGTLWPITPGVFQPTIPGTAPFAAPFVTKVAPDAASLVYSTFLGVGFQSITIAVDSTGEAILTGLDPDPTYPVTPNARVGTLPQFVNNGWLTKLNASGTALVYSSFLSDGNLSPSELTLDGSGNIWIVGSTDDAQFPLVHPFISIIPQVQPPSSTGFIMEFDSTGTQLLFSTYFGGATESAAVQAAVADSAGKIHVSGIAGDTLHTTQGSFQPVATPPPGQTSATFGFAAEIDPNAKAPALCLPSTLSFGLEFTQTAVGQSSTVSMVLTNCGTAPLSLTSAVSSAPLFTVDTTQCATPVAPNATCAVPVIFTPVAAVATTANLALTTNAPFPVSSLPLSGIGVVPVITISPANGATTTATVTAGQTATYNLSIATMPVAAGTATLSCSGVPTNATCTISPSSFNLSSGNAAFTVTVNTQVANTTALIFDGVKLASIGLTFLAPVALLLTRRRRVSYYVRASALLFACMALIALTGCGGGGASPTPTPPQTLTTPPGTYTLTVSATAGTASASQPLTLIVK